MTVSISIIIIDGIDYTFPHKSLQEYFAAILIKDLSIEQKKKVYTDKFNYLQRFTHGGNQNFYNLCYEIDKLAFSEFYILYNLKIIYNNFDLSSHETKVFSFLKLINFAQGFAKNKSTKEYEYRSYSYSSNISELLNYLAIQNFRVLSLDSYKEKASQQIDKIIELGYARKSTKLDLLKEGYYINYTDNWCSDVYEFINYVGLGETIITIIDNIKSLIEKTEQDIITERSNMQSLIDF